LIIAVSTLLITLSLWWTMGQGGGTSLRQALFQVVSIITTTGYASADFDQWPSVAKIILFSLMFIGGSAGSTSGGIKVFRVIVLFKLAWTELKRAIHPKAVINVRFTNKTVDPVVLNTVSIFFLSLYCHLCGCYVAFRGNRVGTVCCDECGCDDFRECWSRFWGDRSDHYLFFNKPLW